MSIECVEKHRLINKPCVQKKIKYDLEKKGFHVCIKDGILKISSKKSIKIDKSCTQVA